MCVYQYIFLIFYYFFFSFVFYLFFKFLVFCDCDLTYLFLPLSPYKRGKAVDVSFRPSEMVFRSDDGMHHMLLIELDENIEDWSAVYFILFIFILFFFV